MLTGQTRTFNAGTVVLAGGSIESPKLLRRSSMFASLPQAVQELVGRGLTDHPTSNEITTFATSIGAVPIPQERAREDHLLFPRAAGSGQPGQIRYPFNVEMNINHEYWHLRENDPNDPDRLNPTPSRPAPGGRRASTSSSASATASTTTTRSRRRRPADTCRRSRSGTRAGWTTCRDSRFPALAGWQKNSGQIFARAQRGDLPDLLPVPDQRTARAPGERELVRPGRQGLRLGNGAPRGRQHADAVPSAVRRPVQPTRWWTRTSGSSARRSLYVCDMSVMPFSSAANPVRTLVALALRLSDHLA